MDGVANGAVIAADDPKTALALGKLSEDMDRLRGRLFMTVEACGLPDRQEKAFKGLIRQQTYDMQADLKATLRGE